MRVLDFIKSIGQFFDSENQKFVKEPFAQMELIYSDVYALVSRVGTDSIKSSQDELERCIKRRLCKVISLKEMFISNNQKSENILNSSQFWNESICFLETVEYLLKPKTDIMTTDIYKNSLSDIFDSKQAIVDYSSDKSLLQVYRDYSAHYCDKLTDHFKKVSKTYHLLINDSYRNIKFLIAIIIIAIILCLLYDFKILYC